MRNRRSDDLSSFELLLDTMCNTFGGVVFIALLLTLLTQSIEITSSSKNNINDSHNSLNQLDSSKVDISNKAALKNVEQIRVNTMLNEERDVLQKIIKDNINLVEATKQNIKQIRNKIELANQDIAKYAKVSHKERKFRLPKLHPINKAPIFIAIKNGRLYTITDISYSIANVSSQSWGNSLRGYDKSDILIRMQNNKIKIELLPDKGQLIKKGAEKSGKLQQAILNINPVKEFINFAVYPDSFKEFNYVKEIFVNRGFDYNWYIFEEQLSFIKGRREFHAQ